MANQKNRYWVAVLYLENMIESWQLDIYDLLQVPFAYCIHNLDKDLNSDHRKDHVHIMIAFANTTTYNHAMEVFSTLSAPGKQALNTCQPCYNVRSMYDYLIHNTEGCKKKDKYLYPSSSRITGNNFDIGSYEQISIEEKNEICREIAHYIIESRCNNYLVLYQYIMGAYDDIEYENCLKANSGHFERLCKGNYLLGLKAEKARKDYENG